MQSGAMWGSPPRVWGPSLRVEHGHGRDRFTPTTVWGQCQPVAANHPAYRFTPTTVGTVLSGIRTGF